MQLSEFVDDPKLIKLIAATDQLRILLKKGEIKKNWTLGKLLSYFRRFDLVFSPEDIYSMIEQKPLKNVVSNVQGDEVIFKGLEPKKPAAEAPPPEQSKDIVSKMAKHARK
jgi:hypothetical protein